MLDHDMNIGRNGSLIIEDFTGASFGDLLSMARGGGKIDILLSK